MADERVTDWLLLAFLASLFAAEISILLATRYALAGDWWIARRWYGLLGAAFSSAAILGGVVKWLTS